jgi:hypothetical protein
MNEQWSVLNPVAQANVGKLGGVGRIDDFSGKRVGLWWNGKPNGDVFLNEVAAQLAARYPGVIPVRIWEERPSTMTFYGVPKEDIAFMASRADVVLGALGD